MRFTRTALNDIEEGSQEPTESMKYIEVKFNLMEGLSYILILMNCVNFSFSYITKNSNERSISRSPKSA
jgi:hypothetical protein